MILQYISLLGVLSTSDYFTVLFVQCTVMVSYGCYPSLKTIQVALYLTTKCSFNFSKKESTFPLFKEISIIKSTLKTWKQHVKEFGRGFRLLVFTGLISNVGLVNYWDIQIRQMLQSWQWNHFESKYIKAFRDSKSTRPGKLRHMYVQRREFSSDNILWKIKCSLNVFWRSI